MKNIYLFWIGDSKKIENMINTIKSQGFNVVVGPSAEDDKYLSENFSYYKKSKEAKIWSFCSDVWRFYMLSKNEGLYIDANEAVGNEFYKLYEEIEKFDVAVVRGSSHTIGSSFLYSSGKKKEVFEEALNLYKKFDNEYVRTFPVGPHVITYVLRNTFTPGFDFEVKDNIAFFSFLFIRDENKYKKVGSASWAGGFNASAYSQRVENNFKTHRKEDSKITRYYFDAKEFPKVNVFGLRDEFDKTNSKKVIKDLKTIYKNSKVKKYLGQRLIWSRLYRLFARRK